MRIENTGVSLRRIWASRILTALCALFLLMDGGMKLFKPPFVIRSTGRLGYPESTIVGIGVTLLVCTVLYLIPRTVVLGAILLTWLPRRGGCEQCACRYCTLQHDLSHSVRCYGVGFVGPPGQRSGIHSFERRMNRERSSCHCKLT